MHVIYITGLGDHTVPWQRRAVKLWRFYGVTPHFFQVGWADSEPFAHKFEKLLRLIDNLRKSGKQVGIIAVSAGASMALHALVERERDLAGVVTICGKLQRPETVGKRLKQENPAFAGSMALLSGTLHKLTVPMHQKLLCLYPLSDHRVALADQYIEGAVKRRVYSFGHVATITTQITLGAYRNIRFLKKVKD